MHPKGLVYWPAECSIAQRKEGRNENEIAGSDAPGGRLDVRSEPTFGRRECGRIWRGLYADGYSLRICGAAEPRTGLRFCRRLLVAGSRTQTLGIGILAKTTVCESQRALRGSFRQPVQRPRQRLQSWLRAEPRPRAKQPFQRFPRPIVTSLHPNSRSPSAAGFLFSP